MKKIKQLTFVLFIFSVLGFSFPVKQVFAQGGAHVSGNHISGSQCDSNPACNPASGTCCNQCDPGPACNPNDPNGIPCCGLEGNNMSSGTLPPRIPAPSGHDKMNHENRRPSGKKHLPEGEELLDALKGCRNELVLKDEQLQKRSQQSSCGRGASQANVDAKKILDLSSDLLELRSDLYEVCTTLAYHHGQLAKTQARRIAERHATGLCKRNGWDGCVEGERPSYYGCRP